MRTIRRRKASAALLLLAALTTVAAGCGNNRTSSTAPTPGTVGEVTESGISADRCEANRQIGPITYLTSFDYAASASILDVVVADAKGYFKAMCLDVKLQPGFSTDNVPVVSDGKVAFSSLGSMSEVAAAYDKKANVQAIALYGHSAIEALAASGKSKIANITDVKGSTMGVLGSVPYSVRLMLVRAGVPLDSFKQVQVPFDATLLDKGDFGSRPVYKSSEPRQLDTANIKYKLFDPAATYVPASFGAMIVNKSFAVTHPTAVEDFLRADLAGFQYALDHPAEAVEMAFKKSDPKYYLTQPGEEFRWDVESKLVRESTPKDKAFGFIDAESVRRETEPLLDELNAISRPPDVPGFTNEAFFKAIHDGNKLVWPTNIDQTS